MANEFKNFCFFPHYLFISFVGIIIHLLMLAAAHHQSSCKFISRHIIRLLLSHLLLAILIAVISISVVISSVVISMNSYQPSLKFISRPVNHPPS